MAGNTMTAPTVTELRPIVAYVLDLFDVPAKPVRAWRPTMYQWNFAGCPIPPTEEAVRQWRMLRPDTLVDVPDPVATWRATR